MVEPNGTRTDIDNRKSDRARSSTPRTLSPTYNIVST